jgi:hypothetical protein
MSAIELAQGFNAGVRAALALAAASADAIQKLPNYREGRQGFATAALRGFVEAGEELLLGKLASAQEVSKSDVGR